MLILILRRFYLSIAIVTATDVQIATYTTDEKVEGERGFGNPVRSSLGKQMFWLCKRCVRACVVQTMPLRIIC